MKVWNWLLAGFALGTAVNAEDLDIWTKTINNDTNGHWYVQPDKPKPKAVKTPELPGEMALRVRARQGTHPWDVQATSPVNGGDIQQGDVVMLMVYLRAETPADGGSQLGVRLQLSGEPYTTGMDFNAALSGEWKSYCAHRVSTADLPAKKTNVSIHLANATQVIDLGPVFVFNFGQGFDRKRLKGCDG